MCTVLVNHYGVLCVWCTIASDHVCVILPLLTSQFVCAVVRLVSDTDPVRVYTSVDVGLQNLGQFHSELQQHPFVHCFEAPIASDLILFEHEREAENVSYSSIEY